MALTGLLLPGAGWGLTFAAIGVLGGVVTYTEVQLKMKPRTAPWMITWWTLALVCLYFTTIVTGIGRLALFIAATILVSAGSWPPQRKGFE